MTHRTQWPVIERVSTSSDSRAVCPTCHGRTAFAVNRMTGQTLQSCRCVAPRWVPLQVVGEVVADVYWRGEQTISDGNARLEVACAGCGGAVMQRQSQHAIGLPAYCTDVCRRKMKTQRERARMAARRLGGA